MQVGTKELSWLDITTPGVAVHGTSGVTLSARRAQQTKLKTRAWLVAEDVLEIAFYY
jgi:hypothetical protein